MTKYQAIIHTLAQENEDLKAEIGRLRQLIHSYDEQVRTLNCEDIDIQKFTEAMKHQPLQVIQPSKDCVSLEVYKQVAWERDIAIEQLKELGYELGEKIKTSDDCVSRAEAIKELKESAEHHANDTREEVLLRRDRDIIRALPPVTPKFPKGATNGDIVKIMFPEYEETRMCRDVRYGSKEYANLEFVVDEDWWDTPYIGNEDDGN